MEILNVDLLRDFKNGQVTIGKLYFNDNMLCHTLERPYLNNKRNISCIPKGKYIVSPYNSPKFGQCFIVNGVENRDFILFHAGNKVEDTNGCILVGESRYITDTDKKILNSKKALNRLLKLFPNSFKLIVKDL